MRTMRWAGGRLHNDALKLAPTLAAWPPRWHDRGVAGAGMSKPRGVHSGKSAVAAPILAGKRHSAPSAFTPENLLREARRQKRLAAAPVPEICVLDPDGDMVRRLRASDRTKQDPAWACYHTELHRLADPGLDLGLVGCAVGAPFAVLVAEQLFASGCRLLISMTSAGRLAEAPESPYFVLIERALRDEGTSYHYLPPAQFSTANPALVAAVAGACADLGIRIERGATWTTDAPFRETKEAIAAMTAMGLRAVEMEAAALYAFATARGKPVLCFAHVTNQMALVEGDFEKGEADGTIDALTIIRAAAEAWRRSCAEIPGTPGA
jgi:uridine phosphorylase